MASRSLAAAGCFALVLALFFVPPASGNDLREMSNLDLASRIFLKILLLDRELETKTLNRVVVGVIGSDRAHRAFNALRGQKLDQNKDFVLDEVVRYESLDEASPRLTLLYVGPGADLAAVSAFTQRNRVLSVTTVQDFLRRGVSVGLAIEGGKPRVVLNLINSNREGLRWDSKMLKISRVIR